MPGWTWSDGKGCPIDAEWLDESLPVAPDADVSHVWVASSHLCGPRLRSSFNVLLLTTISNYSVSSSCAKGLTINWGLLDLETTFYCTRGMIRAPLDKLKLLLEVTGGYGRIYQSSCQPMPASCRI